MPVHRRRPAKVPSWPRLPVPLSWLPRAPLPSSLRSAPAHLAKGTRAPLYARVDREGGDAPEGGTRAGTQTDGGPHKALFKGIMAAC